MPSSLDPLFFLQAPSDPPPAIASEADALRAATVLLVQQGEREAYRALVTRAAEETAAGDLKARAITLAVLAAFHKLTAAPTGQTQH